MIPSSQRKAIADLLRREVVPAIGCTEPMAVALCTARARELLGGLPERIEVLLSANILKNAMGVGIPGTGMIGLPIAVALGAQIGRSECGLEVLRDVTPEAVARARDYLAADAVSVALKEGFAHPLRLSGLRRRGRARPPDGCVVARGRAVRTVDAATGFRLCAGGADRRTGVHRRGAPAQYGCGRIGIGRRIRSFAGADAARPEGAARHGRQPLFPDAGLYLCRVRRPHGGCDGAGDEQLRQR